MTISGTLAHETWCVRCDKKLHNGRRVLFLDDGPYAPAICAGCETNAEKGARFVAEESSARGV